MMANDRLIPELDRTGPDKTVVVDNDDFTSEVKQRIGDFLRAQVDSPEGGKKNSDDRPYATQDEIGRHEATTFFHNLASEDYARLREVLDDNIDAGLSQEDILAAIEGFIGGSSPAADEAAQSTPEVATVVGSISRVLIQNRFNPTSHYGEQFDDDGTIATLPTSLGSYDATGAQVKLGDLKKIGHSLMLRATGELLEGDPTSPGISLGSLLPGQAQVGVKVPVDALQAENVFGAPGRDPRAGRPRQRTLDVIAGRVGEHSRSFGQLNSANEPFDGFLPLGMTGLAIALVTTLRVIVTSLVRTIGTLAGKSFGPGAGKLSTDPLTFGQYGRQSDAKSTSLITLNDIGIVELDRDFAACVDEGIKVFFSFGGDDFGRIARSPGFYANLVRAIVQSSARIITEVVDAQKKLASGDVVAGAQALLGIVNILRRSKAVGFLNVMAVLGDRSFALQDIGVDDAPRGSVIDAIPDNEASRIMKSRVKGPGGETTLAWRNSAPVSNLLLPLDFWRAGAKFAASVHKYRDAHIELRHDIDVSPDPPGGRFSPNDVAAIEKSLDAEYVPFYFHDLRTNEIVSFHAFIASVQESFSPTYGETTAYGRVDPIMTYGGTKRTFDLTFHVVATSPRDFDLMYVKLNKLTTLVYPQYTRGRPVVDAEGRRFIQPFSQVPSASPLCRIRLGNLLKTNFSNVALARLFGVGASDFLTGDSSEVPADKFDAAIESLRKQVRSSGWKPGQIARLLPVIFKKLVGKNVVISSAFEGIEDEELIKNFARQIERPTQVRIVSTGAQTREYTGVMERVYVVELIEPGYEGVRLTVPQSALAIDVAEVERGLVIDAPDVQSTTETDPAREFMNERGNSIVRSFKNIQGKGLAGFITNLSFDWGEANGRWDVERFSARAPQLCKISLSFAVVHDIQPGIDADGMNRAPTHPIGEVMQGTWGDAYDAARDGETHFNRTFARIKGTGKK